ncbi:MAG: anthranilate synthase component I family protein [Bacteroidetes bacterium]|nr:anthranilate synthase component I family protein [Bacteroidota bacterium]HET6244150.1 anthranilate synthase component I family protein [Bacteroidia bacterium]
MKRKVITLPVKEGYLTALEKHFQGKTYLVLNSNDWPEQYDQVIAADTIDDFTQTSGDIFEGLQNYHNQKKDWLFGYLSYELKNRLEHLNSNNPDFLDFPDIYFFRPRFLMLVKEGEILIQFHDNKDNNAQVTVLINLLKKEHQKPQQLKLLPIQKITQKISKQEYIEKIKGIKTHIQKGDIYEMNFCQEFYSKNTNFQPADFYFRLNEISPMPFSCYLHHNNKFLLCASPERYLRKIGNKIISQPIKGTIRRGVDPTEDLILIKELRESQKEKSENVMIVDLVRNDLSRTASRGSVNVEELFKIKSFSQVHQMISTISSELKPGLGFTEVLKTTFPMGSMTGAPKVRAMEIIEEFETTKRGLFSGSVGYITPDGDFDFNVVIRSILYNSLNKYLSFMIGGAITIHADAEKEYEECMLKAKAIFMALNYTEKV